MTALSEPGPGLSPWACWLVYPRTATTQSGGGGREEEEEEEESPPPRPQRRAPLPTWARATNTTHAHCLPSGQANKGQRPLVLR